MSNEIVTFTGRVIDPTDPDPRKINIRDIAHALSNQCRFTGHVREFYSVAQHSVLCANFVLNDLDGGKKLALTALLHDASEAYLSDIARPVKHSEGLYEAYATIESTLQGAISKKYKVPFPFPDTIKKVDDALLLAEQEQLMPRHRHIESLLKYRDEIEPWLPQEAEMAFLTMYTELTRRDPER